MWRAPHRAAHQHRARESTELWEQGADGRVRLVRLFDQHQRGIEYQPDEVESSQKETWQLRRELVTAEMLDPDNLLESMGSGCTRTEQYRWERNGTVHELEWLPQLRLVNSYREQGNGRSVSWQLKQGIYDADEVTGFFKRIDAYQTADYADIGDMESDPFLRQMIRLGFITDPHDNHRGD